MGLLIRQCSQEDMDFVRSYRGQVWIRSEETEGQSSVGGD